MAEIQGHTIGAGDTLSPSGPYSVWALAKHPDVLHKLQTELDEVMPDGQLIKESLRLYGRAPSSLPRVVPSVGQSVEIYGYKLPIGTTVTTQAYSGHRLDSVFEDPTSFKPERWLNETEEMKANYFSFGQGTRACPAQVLSHTILRSFAFIFLALLIRNFNPVLPPQTTDESMEPSFVFSAYPYAKKCDIVFIPRTDVA